MWESITQSLSISRGQEKLTRKTGRADNPGVWQVAPWFGGKKNLLFNLWDKTFSQLFKSSTFSLYDPYKLVSFFFIVFLLILTLYPNIHVPGCYFRKMMRLENYVCYCICMYYSGNSVNIVHGSNFLSFICNFFICGLIFRCSPILISSQTI